MHYLVRFVRSNWLVISLLILASITILSLTPLPKLPAAPGSDKLHHFIAYAALCFPLMLKKPRYWLWGLLLLALWSGAIELIQPFANRYGEWADMYANLGGLACGTCIAYFFNYCYPDK